jgi:short subunit dehydrogenase-like uncharacterized protein
MSQPKKDLDIVILGATGFTGQYAVEDIVKTIDKENQGLVWAIAGRNEAKLRGVLESTSKILGKNLENVPVLVVDVNDFASCRSMAQRTRVVVNCVGPYIFFGENVVKACVETGTHHVDLSGEPQFLESMQLKYHKKAEASGALIVGSCGFDSIPCDLGIYFLRSHCKGELHSVEAYLSVKNGPSGGGVNHGTYDSGIAAIEHFGEIKPIRRQLYEEFYPQRWPQFKHKLSTKLMPHTPSEIGKVCIPFWDTDVNVAKRTHLHNLCHNKERPVQLTVYQVVGSYLKIMVMAMMGLIFGSLVFWKWGRKLLKDYPSIFTFGMFSKEGPSREQVAESSFQVIFIGKGWDEPLSGPTDEPQEPPHKVIVGRVRGPEVAYVATSTFINQAAITLLKDRDQIPFKGGVLTPGLAFRDTPLIERLSRHSITFEILEKH